MEEKFSIINLDGLSDIAIKFLEMIERTVGWVIFPKGSKKDFEEGLLLYKRSIEDDDQISDIEKAVKISNSRHDLKQYINQSKIIMRAAKDIKSGISMNLDEDWLFYFFNHAKNICDEHIQKVWAKILAEKTNGNIGIEKKLIFTLSLMDMNSTKLFENLCKITFEYAEAYNAFTYSDNYRSKNIPLVYKQIHLLWSDIEKKYNKFCLSLDDYEILEELGLIKISNDLEDFEYPYNMMSLRNKSCIIKCCDKRYLLHPKGLKDYRKIFRANNAFYNKNSIKLGYIRYTKMGETLYNILRIKADECLFEVLEKYLKEQNFCLEEVES